jgi:hypothetical protein
MMKAGKDLISPCCRTRAGNVLISNTPARRTHWTHFDVKLTGGTSFDFKTALTIQLRIIKAINISHIFIFACCASIVMIFNYVSIFSKSPAKPVLPCY